MANESKLVKQNVDGHFFVDTTCINCDTCRQLAPEIFGDQGQFSFVYHQPQDEDQEIHAMRALISCPVGSIGNRSKEKVNVIDHFPLPLTENVFYCGFNSPDSYGGNSFFVTHPEGNWLIDSPRFNAALVKRFTALGGIKYIFLTHRDDVADADRYAQTFGAKRIIHRKELSSQPQAEIVIDGLQTVDFGDHFKVIVTPGHTSGHMVLLYQNKTLFTGDHLCYDTETEKLDANRQHCWYDWAEQKASMQKLSQYQFEWILAGHGNRVHLPTEQMHAKLLDLINSM